MIPQYKKPGDRFDDSRPHNDLVRAIDQLERKITEGQIWNHPEGNGLREIIKLQIVDGTEAGKYQVTAGTVNSEDPTLGGVAIGGDPDAEPVVAIPELTVTADTYVWIKCVGVFADPDTYTITIETESTTSPPSGTTITATGFTSFFKIGKIDYTAGTPATYDITNSHSGGNVNVESFGNVNLWFKS